MNKVIFLCLLSLFNGNLLFANDTEVVAITKNVYPTKMTSLKKWRYLVRTKSGEYFHIKARKCTNRKSFLLFGKTRLQKPECIGYYSIKEAILLNKEISLTYEIDFDEHQKNIITANILEFAVPQNGYDAQEHSNFTPSNLNSFDYAQQVFGTLKEAKKSSQCYQRAYAWNYSMSQQFNINSERIYLFFSNRFQHQEDFKYKWWFHVAPMVTINGEKFVMDAEFMKGPTPVRDWLDFFMCEERDPDKVNPYTGKNECLKVYDPCQKIDHYNVFDNNQYSRYCYYRVTNMYHWQPADIKSSDNNKTARSHWDYEELKISHDNAFTKEDN